MKYLKRVLLVMLILLICIITFWFVFKKYYLIEKLRAGIEQSIDEKIENEFRFTLDGFKINWISSRARLNGFNLLFLDQDDTVGYFKGNILVDVKGWMNLLFDEQKQIQNIVLTDAELYYAADHPLMMKSKDGVEAQEVEIVNASATGKLLLADKHQEQSGQLETEFDLTTALNYNSTDEFSVDSLIKQITNFQLSQFHYYMPDGFYQLMVEEVAFSQFDDIMLGQVIINPIHSRKDFAQKKKVATDFISVSIDSIQLLDFDSRIKEQIFIDQIHIHQPSIDVFKDKNYPDNQEFKAVWVDLLQELKTPVYIRAIDLNSMFIKYTQLARGAEEAGDLFFDEVNVKISNITNVEDSVQLSGTTLIEAEATFYGEGLLNTSISYELSSVNGQFGIEGSLGPMDIGKANAILSKNLPVEIKTGYLDTLYFNFSGTSTQSEGDMWFEYSDLKMELLESDSTFAENIMSSIGNALLRNSNPKSNGIFRVGAIEQDRDTTKGTVHYWWLSLQSGFLSTLGVTAERKEINHKTGKDANFFDKIGLGK